MAGDPTLVYIKATAIQQMLAMIPKDSPGWRDLDIQNDKLLKMVLKLPEDHKGRFDNFDQGYSEKAMKAAKASRRKYGDDVRRLYAQGKKVQGLLIKLLEEYDVRTHKKPRKAFRKNMQKLNDHFDKMVYESKQRYMKQLGGLMGGESKVKVINVPPPRKKLKS